METRRWREDQSLAPSRAWFKLGPLKMALRHEAKPQKSCDHFCLAGHDLDCCKVDYPRQEILIFFLNVNKYCSHQLLQMEHR